jgi:O-antigen/teichoic acid export membrane protein
MNQQEIDVARAHIASQDAVARESAGSAKALRARLLGGSMIMLISSGFVGATNLLYNIIIARELGAAEFGHATAIYTLLMLLSSVTLSFQLVCSKFVAKNGEIAAKVAVYKALHRRSWQTAISIGLLTVMASSVLSQYLNLPTWHYIVVLSLGIALYIPLGVRRGLMQGVYDFRRLALNFVLEVAVKLVGAIVLLHFGFGVMGVIAAVTLSIGIAYFAATPPASLRMTPASGLGVSFNEGMQAIVFFVGQVTINNLDIILVKHFFLPWHWSAALCTCCRGRSSAACSPFQRGRHLTSAAAEQ